MPGTAHATLLSSAPITNVRTSAFRRFIDPPLTQHSRHCFTRFRQPRSFPVECPTRRTIAAVYLRVTVLALTAHRGRREGACVLPVTELVTLEAQPRTRQLQRVLVHG